MQNNSKSFKTVLIPYLIIGSTMMLTMYILETYIFNHLPDFEYNIINILPFSILYFILYYNYINKSQREIGLDAELNYELSKKYSKKYPFLNVDVDIYTKYHTENFFNHSPVNLMDNRKTPTITIEEDLIHILDDLELEAVILHELYHFLHYNVEKTKRIIVYTITTLFFSLIFTGLTMGLYHVNNFLGFIIVFVIIILIVLLYKLLSYILINTEVKCDRFSLKIMGKDYITSALNKMLDYERQFVSDQTYQRLLKINNKRLNKLNK